MAKGQQRDPRKEVFWRGVLARFAKSGLSIRAFCRRERFAEPTFYAWRRVVAERDAEPRHAQRPRTKCQTASQAFVPLVVCDNPSRAADGGITVELRGGRVLRLPTMIAVERLGELIRAVEAVGVAMGVPAPAEGHA
jgi:uncharacterized protein (DUF2126 family)